MNHDGRRYVAEKPKSRLSDFNRLAAERLREAAALLASQDDNPYRVAAYRPPQTRLPPWIQTLASFSKWVALRHLKRFRVVGQRIAGGLAELARTGRWTYLERLRGSAEPLDVFCTIPGVGPTLANRLHETLHVETLEQLETALHERDGKPVAGIGPRRLAMLHAALAQI